MRALVVCTSCKRHVKRSDPRCPFCSAAVVLQQTPAGVVRGRPGGRAALFLTGAVLATGCADEHEPDGEEQEMVVPPYGVSLPLDAAAAHPTDAGAKLDAGRDAGPMIVPPYGISVPVYGVAIDASVVPKDAGATCPQLGNLPVPVYGIGIDPAPGNQCRDAGADAGKDAGADAGKDAGADAGADAGKDAGIMVVPPYGIALPAYGIAIDPTR